MADCVEMPDRRVAGHRYPVRHIWGCRASHRRSVTERSSAGGGAATPPDAGTAPALVTALIGTAALRPSPRKTPLEPPRQQRPPSARPMTSPAGGHRAARRVAVEPTAGLGADLLDPTGSPTARPPSRRWAAGPPAPAGAGRAGRGRSRTACPARGHGTADALEADCWPTSPRRSNAPRGRRPQEAVSGGNSPGTTSGHGGRRGLRRWPRPAGPMPVSSVHRRPTVGRARR